MYIKTTLFWIGAPRKDKYNKKLKKYYVEHEEDDESGVEDNETLREEDQQVGIPRVNASQSSYPFLVDISHIIAPSSRRLVVRSALADSVPMRTVSTTFHGQSQIRNLMRRGAMPPKPMVAHRTRECMVLKKVVVLIGSHPVLFSIQLFFLGSGFTMPQEYKDLKKLGDSLLTRSGKISDLITKLESAVQTKDDQSPEKKRAQRSRTLFSY